MLRINSLISPQVIHERVQQFSDATGEASIIVLCYCYYYCRYFCFNFNVIIVILLLLLLFLLWLLLLLLLLFMHIFSGLHNHATLRVREGCSLQRP